jgi:FAD/FMN-containing dehydrogenase
LSFNDWEKAYFGDGYEKLQEIKKAYDPENLFDQKQTVRLKE